MPAATVGGITVPSHVGGCFKRMLACLAAADRAGALEALAAAGVSDIQQYQQAFLKDAKAAAMLGDLACEALQPTLTHLRRATLPEPASARRMLLCVPSIIAGQAASMNVVRLVESLRRERWTILVMVAEEFTARSHGASFLTFPDFPSTLHGRAMLARLRESASVTVLPTTDTFLGAGLDAVKLARDWRPSIAAFVASPACPIQTVMALARVAPRQVVLNIGVPLVVPGVDAILYNNPRREREDSSFLASRSIAAMGVATSGGDAASGVAAIPIARDRLGSRSDNLLLVTASNRLEDRCLAGSFAADLAEFLREHPHARWIGIGPGQNVRLRRVFDTAGVRDSIRLVGASSDIRPIVKACDVYLNEYPEGGGNSVIEAMGCGVPVAAWHAGTRHAECIGADLSSDDAPRSLDGYWSLVGDWAADPARRDRVGREQQRRALEKLDYAVICSQYTRMLSELDSRARHDSPAPPAPPSPLATTAA